MQDVDEAVLARRERTISDLRNVLALKYGEQYQVQAFGSTVYGVSTEKSDLDLIIMVRHGHSQFAAYANCVYIRRIRKGWMQPPYRPH